MKATKAHFEMIANVMRVARNNALANELATDTQLGQVELVRQIAQDFAAELARTNPAFDRARFLKACEA